MMEPKHPPRAMLTFLFSLLVFIILIITMLITGGVIFLLVRAGVLVDTHTAPNLLLPITSFAVTSVLAGTMVGTIVGRFPLRPINRLIDGMNRLAEGHFETRIQMGANPVSQEIEKSFNTLAGELENTEVLRSDFVNNFSHEFKTPIVSIRGFAKLLQKETLTEQQRQEYLSIIIEESRRLSVLATNVLDLTKLENQKILTGVTSYNVSEQLRNCILLLEKGWTEKALGISADFDEHMIMANEEQLKQVWINILHNAIKFSPESGEVKIDIVEAGNSVDIAIKNHGPAISEEAQKRVFDKFWQGDASHAASGTGIGLSIAKRIVQLHRGEILLQSSPEETVFTVRLPRQPL